MKSFSKPNNSLAELLIFPLMLIYAIGLVIFLMTTSSNASAETDLTVENTSKRSGNLVDLVNVPTDLKLKADVTDRYETQS